MADQHHHHRPNRISLPQRATIAAVAATPNKRSTYAGLPFPPLTPAPTPSKHRQSFSKNYTGRSSFSFLLLLLFSLRSLYSLLPFLRSSPPSFSIFPFSFLVSLLSFVLTLTFTLSASTLRSGEKSRGPVFSLNWLTRSQQKGLVAKSLLLAVVFLLRFQALRYCGTAAMILAEVSGNVAARFIREGKDKTYMNWTWVGYTSMVRGFTMLFSGLILLSVSWDRVECFPLSHVNMTNKGFMLFPSGNCFRIGSILLPLVSGFLGYYERTSWNWGEIREMGQKRVRLITLFFTTVLLFVPAAISMLVFEAEGDSISISSLGWPLANTVVFGVLLSENYIDEKVSSSKDAQKEFLVTFLCTIALEMFYFPDLSLWGLLICGFFIWIAVRDLNHMYANYPELGYYSSESLSMVLMKTISHILSERKSRKIALFLLINTAYMVVEFVVGFTSNSLGLISDACHMLFDCAALAIGLYASYISRLPANSQFNYGRGRFEVLSGYVNAVFLVLVGTLITLESFERILDPEEISTSSLLAVSIGGLVVNIIGLLFFHEEHHHAHGGSGACSHSHSHDHHVQENAKRLGDKNQGHATSCCDGHNHHWQQHHHDQHHGHVDSHKHYQHKVSPDNHHHHLADSHDHHSHHVDLHDDHHHNHQHRHVDSNDHHHNHQHRHVDSNDHQHHHLDSHDHHHHHDDQHDHHSHHVNRHEHHHHHADSHGHHHHHDDSHNYRHELADSHDHVHHQHELADSHDHVHHQHELADSHDHVHHHVDSHGHRHHVDKPDHLDHHYLVDHHNHSHSHQLLEKKGKKDHHHHHIDHNMQGIFLHVLADTLGSVGVVISTLLIKYKGWLVADPACSIFISALIVSSVIPLLRNSAEVLLQRVPRSCEEDVKEAINDLLNLNGISGIQNLHVWSFTNTDVVGTIHLQVSKDTDMYIIKRKVSDMLQDAGIKDLTIQVEST